MQNVFLSVQFSKLEIGKKNRSQQEVTFLLSCSRKENMDIHSVTPITKTKTTRSLQVQTRKSHLINCKRQKNKSANIHEYIPKRKRTSKFTV